MNVQVNIDMTPEELRRLMGLPDVQEFNQKVMEQMLQKMQEGAEGFDPTSIFTSSIGGNVDVMKSWMNLFGNFASGKSVDK